MCGRDTCNGPSLPPKDFLDNHEDIIDIEEVVREMNEVKEAKPAPIAAAAAGHNYSTSISAQLLVIISLIRTFLLYDNLK